MCGFPSLLKFQQTYFHAKFQLNCFIQISAGNVQIMSEKRQKKTFYMCGEFQDQKTVEELRDLK